jgi:hypothetical protein
MASLRAARRPSPRTDPAPGDVAARATAREETADRRQPAML